MTQSRWPALGALRALVAPLVVVGVLTGVAAPAGAASASACTRWTGVRPPNPAPLSDDLFGVAVLSRSNAWAVGDDSRTGQFRTLIEHWNGRAWRQVPSPNPGRGDNYLTSVHAVSATSIWAVGGYATQSGGIVPNKTLILHWNGRRWAQQPSPSPAGRLNELNGVHAISGGAAWAVGLQAGSDNNDKTLILHWNGTRWSRVASPSPAADSVLSGVDATGHGNAWAVGLTGRIGQTLALRWNGRRWSRVASPDPDGGGELESVSATSARNAWAVGDTAKGRSLTLHWNGRRWQHVTSPNIEPSGDDNLLSGVAATSAGNAWAVGTGSIAFGDGATGFILHWNGHGWRRLRTPAPVASTTNLYSVAASSASSAWVVGIFAPDTARSDQKTYALRCR
jgi:hypothetical protein